MNWTTEAPTVDGWYWWRQDENDPPECVEVARGLGAKLSTVWSVGDEYSRTIDSLGGMWLGPISTAQLLNTDSTAALVKELDLTRKALEEAVSVGECKWQFIGEGWYKAECRPDQEEWAYNEDWQVCPYCRKSIIAVYP